MELISAAAEVERQRSDSNYVLTTESLLSSNSGRLPTFGDIQLQSPLLSSTPEHSAHGGSMFSSSPSQREGSLPRGGAFRAAVQEMKQGKTLAGNRSVEGSGRGGVAYMGSVPGGSTHGGALPTSRSSLRSAIYAAEFVDSETSGGSPSCRGGDRSFRGSDLSYRSGDRSFRGADFHNDVKSLGMRSIQRSSQAVAAMFETDSSQLRKKNSKGKIPLGQRKNTAYGSIRARLNWQNAVRLAVQYARMHPDSARDERSVHGSLSKGKKILTFFELTKAHTKGSGHAMLNTLQQPQHHSRSRMLHDASHRHTANHKIPKYKCIDGQGRKVKSPEAANMPPWLIHPFNPWWRAFLYVTVVMAALTGLITPFVVAFQSNPGLCPYTDFPACFEYIAAAVFGTDIVLSFFRCYYLDEVLITDRLLIAKHYLRLRFWVDIIALLPFDYVIIEAVFPPCIASNTARYVSILKLLRLLRMYRVLTFFRLLEFNLSVGLLVVTIVRNATYALYVVHWAACAFYFIARQEGRGSNTWFGGLLPTLVATWPTTVDAYIFSLYWSVTTFATVGYGDFHANSVPEALFCVFFMFLNVGITAYILGTITMVVIKNDERTGRFRDRSSNIKAYTRVNNVPRSLHLAMLEHLRLHFNNEEASDEQVLSVLPGTIRRRVLRHLYLAPMQQCYLFADCKQKFLDALLAAARMELFMPQVEILAEGDHVNELMVVVSGLVELRRPSEWMGKYDAQESILNPEGKSIYLGSRQILGDGDTFGEVAFFTEIPQIESVHSMTVAKVLSISRTAFNAVSASFPIGARTVLENLGELADTLVEDEFKGRNLSEMVKALPSGVTYKWASEEMMHMHTRPEPTMDHVMATHSDLKEQDMSLVQEQVLSNMLRVRTLVQQHLAKADEEKTTDWLYAASKGTTSKIRQMLRQGFGVDTCDYDGRTGLMLATAQGHLELVESLLDAGAQPSLQDSLGGSALMEACKNGHDNIVSVLHNAGATLGLDRINSASQLCTLVFKCDLPLLRRYLAAGIDVNAGDYDDRTALHIAACESNLAVTKLFVREGCANVWVRDRWGKTAYDEAIRVGSKAVAAFLATEMGKNPEKSKGSDMETQVLAGHSAVGQQ